ncbi:hypothetical protein B7P43_G08909 [Cryptotermes secundus]|uniref:Uncharacterized protein n=1 Tax=Cryptotermes secundus TaxID=105785 RepID=A0A2J7QTE4_9NEOP|nr:hypothetical protein B7P43_G08909 [Cryptotermes secundus]
MTLCNLVEWCKCLEGTCCAYRRAKRIGREGIRDSGCEGESGNCWPINGAECYG